MPAITLGYHDIIDQPLFPAGGLDRPCPRAYAIHRAAFRDHLQAMADCEVGNRISTVDATNLRDGSANIFLTFDDGAVGAYTCVADELERFGWRGHFFITTSWIGQPGFLSKAQIRNLHARGHMIGSHTVSHPARMSSLRWDDLITEWADSRAELMDAVGTEVYLASVAHGYYSRKVGSSAAATGIKVLFNSEPRTSVLIQDGCLVLGRYSVQPKMSPAECVAIAKGHWRPRFRQAALWQMKKVIKIVAGDFYLLARSRVLAKISDAAR